jgi:hypothetical protein
VVVVRCRFIEFHWERLGPVESSHPRTSNDDEPVRTSDGGYVVTVNNRARCIAQTRPSATSTRFVSVAVVETQIALTNSLFLLEHHPHGRPAGVCVSSSHQQAVNCITAPCLLPKDALPESTRKEGRAANPPERKEGGDSCNKLCRPLSCGVWPCLVIIVVVVDRSALRCRSSWSSLEGLRSLITDH